MNSLGDPRVHGARRGGNAGTALGCTFSGRSSTYEIKRQQVTLSLLALGVILLLPIVTGVVGIPASSLIYPACILLTLLFVVQIWSWNRVSNSLFDPYTIFAIAAVLFNGSRATLEVFGSNYNGVLGPEFSEETTLRTIYLVILALWSFHVGGLLGASPTHLTPAINNERQEAESGVLLKTGWLLIIIAVVPSFMLLQEAAAVAISSGYSGLFQIEKAVSFRALPQVLSAFLVPGALFLTAGSRRAMFPRAVSMTLILAYFLVQLYIGSRSLAVASIVPYAWLWHRCIRPIPKGRSIFFAILLSTIVLPVIGKSRLSAGEDRLSPQALVRTFSTIGNPLVAIISELGGSAITIGYTTDLVPESRPYDLGASYLQGALTIFPNLFWDVHPAIARGTPETWLIQTVDPYIAERGGGLGYSFIAEAYFNGGWVGVIVICCALGFGFARLAVASSNSTDLAKMAFVATVMAFILKYVRSDCTEIFRGVVWYAFGPYAVASLWTKLGSGQFFQPRIHHLVGQNPRTGRQDLLRRLARRTGIG